MKKLLLLTVTFLSLNSRGQVWCTPGSVWHFRDGGLFGSGYKQLEYLYDTVIAGKTCNKLKEIRTGIKINGTYKYTRYFYTHTTNNVVYLNQDTLYNFNAVIGDKWRLPPTTMASCTNSYVTVIDTGHTMIQGQNLKWFKVVSSATSFFVNINWFYGTVYERIGAVQSYPYYGQNNCPSNSDAGNGGPMYCFSDYQISEYNLNSSVSCKDLYISLDELSSDDGQVKLYPNPSQDRVILTFNNPAGKEVQLSVTDVSGRTLKNILLAPGKEDYLIDLNGLSSGVYFVTLKKEQEILYKVKLIREE